MLANISQESLDAIGAKDVSEFPAKLTAFVAVAKQTEKFMAENPTLFTEARVSEMISAATKNLLTEAKAGEIITGAITTAIPAAMTAWAGSEAGKKLIGAESSRITAEAMAAVGTSPVKPSPAAAIPETTDDRAKGLLAEGKFEEAYPLLPAKARAEFMSAKEYGAYMRAIGGGMVTVKISKSAADFSTNRN